MTRENLRSKQGRSQEERRGEKKWAGGGEEQNEGDGKVFSVGTEWSVGENAKIGQEDAFLEGVVSCNWAGSQQRRSDSDAWKSARKHGKPARRPLKKISKREGRREKEKKRKREKKNTAYSE
jgi:hypothetical protein